MGFYVEVTQTPNRSGFAAEDIPAGTVVVLEDGEANLADAAEHESFDGVADTPRRGEYIASFDHESSDFVYLAEDPDPDNHAPLGFQGYDGEGDTRQAHLVPVAGGADGDYIRVRTIPDVDGATAPAVEDGAVVGFIDTTVVDGVEDAAGYIVEEGYEDENANKYSRDEGNFVAIGRAYKPDHLAETDADGVVDDHDYPVRVRVNKGL